MPWVLPFRIAVPCLSLLAASGLSAQVPLEQVRPEYRALVEDVLRRCDFTFDTRTPPKRVQLSVMEQLFDHPRMSAAMWRYCRFVPSFYVTEHPDGAWTLDDARGLRGTLRLVAQQPGMRVYLVEGRAEAGRLKALAPAVGARMVTVYRYWEGPAGFESRLQTWTALDSALLGFLSKPFQGYVRHRQDEFIAYINGNVALFGEFAARDPREFQDPIHREGDPVAMLDFQRIFPRR